MKIFRAIIRGMGYVEGYGHHPGTPMIVMFLVFGTLAAGWFGLAAVSTTLLPAYLWGAYDRGK